MTISSINIAFGASYGAYNQKLTKETKEKLIALGIPFDVNISESEGKKLLASASANKSQNNQPGFKEGSNQKDNLFEQAKNLAKKLGIQVDEKIDFQKLLSLIETVLNEKISANSDNIQALKYLKTLNDEFTMIQAQCGQGMYNNNTKNESLMDSLELLSKYNKNFL